MGLALDEEVPPNEDGNNPPGPFVDYLVPMAAEPLAWETRHTVTPSPHQSAKGVGESATVGVPPAIANAVVDTLAHLGVTHVEIPIRLDRVCGRCWGGRVAVGVPFSWCQCQSLE